VDVTRRQAGLAVAALLAVLAVELAYAIRADGLTVDEVVYIGSGYRHLKVGDYRLIPEHPPLGKMAVSLPLLALDLKMPPGRSQWAWPYEFVHEANETGPIVVAARMGTATLTLILALAVWRWCWTVGGRGPALVALVFLAFHPSILAHGHLATTDLPQALTMLLASWAFWRWCQSPGLVRGLLVGGTLGAAVVTRLTGWLLVPSFVALALLHWRGLAAEARGRFPARAAGLVGSCFVVVPLVVWAVYGFRYAPWPGRSVLQPAGSLGVAGAAIERAAGSRLLPEAYLEGIRFQLEHERMGHPTYLLGEVSTSGWPHYYLVAFLVKNTPGFLLAALGALVLLWRERRALGPAAVEAHWAVPAAVTFLAASLNWLQIGERYILALYPYLVLLIGSAVSRLASTRRGRGLVVAAVALHVVPSVLSARGGYLTYFNALAGGPAGGHRVLVDSNLDWGQDLPRLAAWMRRNGVERVQLGYHGSDDPDRYGIVREDLPGLNYYRPRPATRPFEGVVVVSPNLLTGIVTPREGGDPYAFLRGRRPDDRAGVFFVFRLGPG
jgi:hypothetical protein